MPKVTRKNSKPKKTPVLKPPKKQPIWVEGFFEFAADEKEISVDNYDEVLNDFTQYYEAFYEMCQAKRPIEEKKPENPLKALEKAQKICTEALMEIDPADTEKQENLKANLARVVDSAPQVLKDILQARNNVEEDDMVDEDEQADEEDEQADENEKLEIINVSKKENEKIMLLHNQQKEKAVSVLQKVNESMATFNNEVVKREIPQDDPLRISVENIYTNIISLVGEQK